MLLQPVEKLSMMDPRRTVNFCNRRNDTMLLEVIGNKITVRDEIEADIRRMGRISLVCHTSIIHYLFHPYLVKLTTWITQLSEIRKLKVEWSTIASRLRELTRIVSWLLTILLVTSIILLS